MIDTTSLFLHVLAAVGIVGGGLAQVLVGQRLRGAEAAGEVALWARFARTLGLVIAAAALLSFLTGGHLAGAVWTTEESSGFAQPFITLGAAALVLLAPIGPMLGGKRLRELAASADGEAPGAASAGTRAAAVSPALWGPVHSLLGVGVGLVALMVYKPSWVVGAILLLVTFVGGWASGLVAARR